MTVLLKFGEEKILEGEYVIFQPDVSEEVFWEYVNEDSNCELINGVLVIHSPASEEHEDIFSYLNALFRLYLEKNNAGKIYGSRFVMKLSKKWNSEPDLFIVLPNNYSNIKYNYYEGPADLVIEILSKSTRELDLEKKLPEFLRVGVKEVWIIDSQNKELSIFHKNDNQVYKNYKSDEIVKSQVLPKFKFKIKWLWFRKEFPVIQVFQDL
jgi:Uma2 family endonuclease